MLKYILAMTLFMTGCGRARPEHHIVIASSRPIGVRNPFSFPVLCVIDGISHGFINPGQIEEFEVIPDFTQTVHVDLYRVTAEDDLILVSEYNE